MRFVELKQSAVARDGREAWHALCAVDGEGEPAPVGGAEAERLAVELVEVVGAIHPSAKRCVRQLG